MKKIKPLVFSLAILLFLFSATMVAIMYGRGYRFGLTSGKIELSGTGLLVVSSLPDGAQVLVNDKLSTATNDTINLFPGQYSVKIVKDGYFVWQKSVKVQKEVVTKIHAFLLPNAPKLESITALGVTRPVIDPSGSRLAYTIASQSAKKNGVYVMDMTTRPILTLQSASTQIVSDAQANFSDAQLSWSPDGTEIVATISASPTQSTTYLLDASGFNNNIQDITNTLPIVNQTWEKEIAEKEKARMATLKAPLRKLLEENFRIISYSADETKILYTASASATLSYVIKPRLIGIDSTPEQRNVVKDKIYVYDIREDKNYELPISNFIRQFGGSNSQGNFALGWMPDSKRLLYTHDKKIDIMEFDGGNQTTVFAGPFEDNFVFPWPSGSKIVMLTNLGNTNISSNLYIITLE
ncbi:MAG: PEGA domain-containing protein [Patescibacteria group bacterium]